MTIRNNKAQEMPARSYNVIVPVLYGTAAFFVSASIFLFVCWRREWWNIRNCVGCAAIGVAFYFSARRCRRQAQRIELEKISAESKTEAREAGHPQRQADELNPWFVAALIIVAGLTMPFIPDLAFFLISAVYSGSMDAERLAAGFANSAIRWLAISIRIVGAGFLMLGIWLAVRDWFFVKRPASNPDAPPESD